MIIKSLRVLEFRDDEKNEWITSEALVFSLNLNSWRRIKNFWSGISTPYKQSWGAQVNGAFHTILLWNYERGNRAKGIVAFDIRFEALQLFDLPKFVNRLCGITTQVFGGCLCIAGSHIDGYSIDRIDIWMMKEYGVKESWSKLLSIESPETLIDVRPIVYSKNRHEVLLYVEDMGLVWYDLRKTTMISVSIHGVPPLIGADTYVGSLVPLNGCHDQDEIKKRHGQGKFRDEKKNKR